MRHKASHSAPRVAFAMAALAAALLSTLALAQDKVAKPAATRNPATTRALQEYQQSRQQIRIEQVQTPVEALPEPPQPAAAPAATPEGGAPALALDRARRVVLTEQAARTSEAVVRDKVLRTNPELASGTVVILPGAIEAPTATGGSVEIRHVAIPGRRLEYDSTSDEFAGTLKVGVVAFGGETSAGLKEPVTFQVLESGSEESSTVVVSGLAPPFTSIPIKVKNPRPPIKLRVASGTDQPSEEVTLPIAPTLFVWPASSELSGDGLGETELPVVAVGEDVAKGQVVQLTAEPAATFSEAIVKLDDNGVATARIKSVGSGEVVVRARAPGFTAAPARLVFKSVLRKLAISTESNEIQGYGIGATFVTVVATAQDLKPGQSIQLNATPRASFERDDGIFTLDAGGKATVKIRSEGTGPVLITASAPGFEPAQKDMMFEPPVETIGASIVGGLLGAIARTLSRRRRSVRPITLAGGLVLSVIVGVLVVALFAIGINVLPIAPKQTTGAIVVFTLAAIGAFIGVAALPGGKGKPKLEGA